MVDKLFKAAVCVVLLAWLAWHYRDAGVVREHQALVESMLIKAGMEPATVHRYWNHEQSAGSGSVPVQSAPSAVVQSAWDDFLTRYNLIAQLRERKNAVEQGQVQGDDAQKRTTTP